MKLPVNQILGNSRNPYYSVGGVEKLIILKNCPHWGQNELVANLQGASTVGDVAQNIPRINASLEDRQADYHLTMIELEGKIQIRVVSILVDPGASLSYIHPRMVETSKL